MASTNSEAPLQTGPHPMIPVPQALRTVLAQTAIAMKKAIDNSTTTEMISLHPSSEAGFSIPCSPLLGRIPAHDISMPQPGYPPYDASIMDGYAIDIGCLNFKDGSATTKSSTIVFHVVDRIYAGAYVNIEDTKEAFGHRTEDNTDVPRALYVTTGAVIPPPFNAVIPVEDIILQEETDNKLMISIPTEILRKVKKNVWIRPVGCDIPPNTVIISKGDVIRPHHVGLLVQCGVESVEVQCFPKVGVLSTGNELIQSPSPQNIATQNAKIIGKIPDANRPILLSLLHSYGNCTAIDIGIVSDDKVETLEHTLSGAISKCDVIITTGGISMGEKDIIENILVNKLHCRVHFGRLNMKPGKPTTFATVNKTNVESSMLKKCLIFALPGNPVSATVCSELLVRPCLDMLHGGFRECKSNQISEIVQNAIIHPEANATLTNKVKLDTERPEYLRVNLSNEYDSNGPGTFLATSTGVQRSSRLMSMCHADGLMVLPQGIKGGKVLAEPGETYPVLLLRHTINIKGALNGTQVKHSIHFKRAKLTVGILQILGGTDKETFFENLEDRVINILGRDQAIVVQSFQIYGLDSLQKILSRELSDCVDILLIICSGTTLQSNLQLADILRSQIHKEADGMALQARRGAANVNPISALFQPIIGFIDSNEKSCMMICLPEQGLEGALISLKDLLKHALSVGRGK